MASIDTMDTINNRQDTYRIGLLLKQYGKHTEDTRQGMVDYLMANLQYLFPGNKFEMSDNMDFFALYQRNSDNYCAFTIDRFIFVSVNNTDSQYYPKIFYDYAGDEQLINPIPMCKANYQYTFEETFDMESVEHIIVNSIPMIVFDYIEFKKVVDYCFNRSIGFDQCDNTWENNHEQMKELHQVLKKAFPVNKFIRTKDSHSIYIIPDKSSETIEYEIIIVGNIVFIDKPFNLHSDIQRFFSRIYKGTSVRAVRVTVPTVT